MNDLRNKNNTPRVQHRAEIANKNIPISIHDQVYYFCCRQSRSTPFHVFFDLLFEQYIIIIVMKTLIILSIAILINQALKTSNKNSQTESNTPQETNINLKHSPTNSAQVQQQKQSSTTSIATTSITHSTTPDQQKQQNSSPSIQHQIEKKDHYVLDIIEREGQYALPISVEDQKYFFGLEHSLDIPSWIFTNRTKKHEVCFEEEDCQNFDPIKCSDKACFSSSEKAKKNSFVKGQSLVKLVFSSKNQQFNQTFVDAETITSDIKKNSIQGIFNIHSFNFTLINNQLKLGQQHDDGLNPSENIKIKFNNQKSGKKFKFQSVIFSFHSSKHLFSVPQSIYKFLLDKISNQYLNGKCKTAQHNKIHCSSKVKPTNYPLQFCFDSCFKLNIESLVRKDGQSYILQVDKNEETQNIVFYPRFSTIYDISVNKNGEVVNLKQNQNYKVTTSAEGEEQDESQRSEKTIQQEEEETQESEEESYVQKLDHKKHKNHKLENPEPEKTQQSSFSKTLLISFLIYGSLALLIILVIKMKASESYAGQILNRVVNLAIYQIFHNFFNRRQGYTPSNDMQDENEEIDYGDKVSVGYNEKQGRDLFWEKKSAEGI